MYERVIPKYCVRMKDNKRESLFYGQLPNRFKGTKALVSFNNDIHEFQVFNSMSGKILFIPFARETQKKFIVRDLSKVQIIKQFDRLIILKFYYNLKSSFGIVRTHEWEIKLIPSFPEEYFKYKFIQLSNFIYMISYS